MEVIQRAWHITFQLIAVFVLQKFFKATFQGLDRLQLLSDGLKVKHHFNGVATKQREVSVPKRPLFLRLLI